MISASNSLTSSAFDAIWLASPPPPFPTTSFISSARAFLHRYCYGLSGSNSEQSPVLRYDSGAKSPIILKDDVLKSASALVISFSPVLSLDSPQSFEKMYYASQNRFATVYVIEDTVFPDESVFKGKIGVGLGLGLSLPYSHAAAVRSEASDQNDHMEGRTSAWQTTTVQPRTATWGIFDALVSFLDITYPGSPATQSSPASPQSLTGILPHIFTSPTLSPMTFWRPTPPTPEPECPRHLVFQGTPVYNVVSPQLPIESGKRARCRPSPRRPRLLSASSSGVDVKSPVLEYSRSMGTTPYDRHGWDPIESFNVSRRRSPKKSSRHRPHRRPLHQSPQNTSPSLPSRSTTKSSSNVQTATATPWPRTVSVTRR
ncbi:hypothetical protein B0H12DRAFT_157268 [Mycena haematopus]|nr:hypothetical protein B0H12DRAFT_157268 [Mycena haematopus]